MTVRNIQVWSRKRGQIYYRYFYKGWIPVLQGRDGRLKRLLQIL